MRLILAGLLLLTIPTLAFGQATGEVQSIGFNGSYRPNCWTPMIVRLRPQTTESANYEIQVWQHDLDGDRPIYTRPVVLNGSDQVSSQLFWMYFLPQPIDKGLPDQSNGTLHDLQRDLQVFLCTPGPSGKQIAQLPITSQLQNIDPFRDSYAAKPRGAKLILAVSTNGSRQPTLAKYNSEVGALEDVEVVNIRMNELPEDPIGYDAVDGIIWLDGNPNDLASQNLDSLAALKDYVRYGGHLVVCQSTANWQEDLGFGDMLPVDVTGIDSKSDFEPLKSMAAPQGFADPFQTAGNSWLHSTGPYQMARSTARNGTVVDNWIDWQQDGSYADATPYLARKSYGLGQVTWVAQQLTTESAPGNPTSWPYIWDKVFGWKSAGYVLPDKQSPDDLPIKVRLQEYAPGTPLDLGYTLVQGLNLNSKANWLILLAVGFFLVYWLIAGPGSYAYLAAKKQQSLSWFFFGIAAVGATLVTVLVVKLVLRGPPEIRHLSFVRVAPGQPAIVNSRFGLYIPRDGDQKIELEDSSPASVSYLAPFAEHPQQLGGDVTEFPSPTDYTVPVRDLKSDTPPQITVAYRSSLKKFQARWVGDLSASFIGSAKLDPKNPRLPLNGFFTNASGVDLTEVYLAFNAGGDHDWMLYVPHWAKGASYDLQRDLGKPFYVGKEGDLEAVPGDNKIICDELASTDPKRGWMSYWHSHFYRTGSTTDDPNVSESDYNFIYPMLSLFDRLPAMANTVTIPAGSNDKLVGDGRVELFNRGARQLNASSSVSAGQLVILATAKGPVPMPLQIDDNKIEGDGTVFYQFILPIDRGNVAPPTTSPTTRNAE